MSEALRFCPFCRAGADTIHFGRRGGPRVGEHGWIRRHRWVVICDNCGARGPSMARRESAVRVWNATSRHAPDEEDE